MSKVKRSQQEATPAIMGGDGKVHQMHADGTSSAVAERDSFTSDVQPSAEQVTQQSVAETQPPSVVDANGTQPKESKRDRFVRLVEQRMPKVVARLESIQSLANKSNYDPDAATVDDILRVLNSHVTAIALAFAGGKRDKGGWR